MWLQLHYKKQGQHSRCVSYIHVNVIKTCTVKKKLSFFMYMICDNLYTEIGYTLSKESYLVISVSDSEEFISFVTFINIDPYLCCSHHINDYIHV